MTRILVVEDSETDLELLRGYLEKNGFDVLTAQNGEDGMRLAREKKPDAILMDIVMPGVNGFQATRKLARDPDTGDIPVIIVSSKDQSTDRIWAERQGAAEYITKPVEEAELVDKLRAVLR